MHGWVVLNKKVGDTPLACMEAWRATQPAVYQNLPLTYAGRLDPLASGKLLVLIGETCKAKEQYLALDKAYTVTVVFGVGSDSGDVLGLATAGTRTTVPTAELKPALRACRGTITLPYPSFSSKPVKGKPLHTWAAEGRLAEITIPQKTSTIYQLRLQASSSISAAQLYQQAREKIASIPPVTEQRKALGNDFRRAAILEQWENWYQSVDTTQRFSTAKIHCICSSGTYMRSLAEQLGTVCDTKALALGIHRSRIGQYQKLGPWGYWSTSFSGASSA